MELTARQKEVIRVIDAFTAIKGYPPTLREIGARLGITLGTVQDHLENLRRLKILIREPKKARARMIKLVEPLS